MVKSNGECFSRVGAEQNPEMPRQRFCLTIVILTECCFALIASGQMTYPPDVEVLQAVRRNLKDPGRRLSNWKKTDPCVSKWAGVLCLLQDDGYLHVDELRLLKKNLSGTLAPELGQLSYARILNFMWNNISGSIPEEIGSMISLQLLLLSGNQISGALPDQLGNLPNLTRFQVDINNVSGPLPISFANLNNARHFHMNNNSISGQIPQELSRLPNLIHFLLDNNNLSGYLPPELSKMRNLRILQLDNNNFNGTEIPDSYGTMAKLLKLSLRNCNLQGTVPDLSNISRLLYLDLSLNHLSGSIPSNKLADSMTTIDLSHNTLNGSIPSYFSSLPHLQKLLLKNNKLSGSVPNSIWKNITIGANETVVLDFQNNELTNISGLLDPPENVSLELGGNPVCAREKDLNIAKFCGLQPEVTEASGSSYNSTDTCPPQSCPTSDYFEYVQQPSVPCFCALPLGVGLRLRSPSFSDFRPYISQFNVYITSNLSLAIYQLSIDSFIWEEGPRLRMYLKLFPQYNLTGSNQFNESELQRIVDLFATFNLTGTDLFGPYDLLNFTLLGTYADVSLLVPAKSGISRVTLLGIVIGTTAFIIAILLAVAFFFRKLKTFQDQGSRRKATPKLPIKTEAVKEFTFAELDSATSGFSITSQVGQGGYGKVYKGILADGMVVAIKRAQPGSLQGRKEFLNEIEFLCRLHHRNLVSLVGYCNEAAEQMLVYEFMPNGSLRDILSDRFKVPLHFAMRLHIALGSANGILYLHSEADPPIIHRDVKANNILLDYKFTAKVSDFGISRLAQVQSHDHGVAADTSSVVKGTPGYLDPDYFMTHQLTEKSDVYSLGIVFLELLTGMLPISFGRYIVTEVQAACRPGTMYSVVDKSMGSYPPECVRKFMALALKCCEEETEGRPTMLEVVRELEDICSILQESDLPSEPEASSSRTSGDDRVPLRLKPFVSSSDYIGSDLISDAMPTIRPR